MAEKALSVISKLIAAFADAAAGVPVNVSVLCDQVGVSRKHYYALKKRFDEGGAEAVLARNSRRPLRSPMQLDPAVEDLVVGVRKQLVDDGWDAGARTIAIHLARAGVDPVPAVSTIHNALRRRGLVDDQPQKRPRSAMRRFEYDASNACWQLDGTETVLAGGKKACILEVIDDHSRKRMKLLAARAETTESAWECTQAAIIEHGPPARMLTDRGTALNGHPDRESVFRDRLRRHGVLPISSRGYHPQTCGKNERGHQTLHQWLAARGTARTLPELQTLLDEYTERFNSWRPHQSLASATPDSRYYASPKTGPLGALEPQRSIVTQVLVSGRGEVRSGEYTIQVGRSWHGARVTVIREDLNVVVLSDNQLIRRLVINPDNRYQGNGRPHPRSPKPHPRKVLPMS